jgi:hypothetical protein
MNNKAQIALVGFMLAAVILFLALAFMPSLNQVTTSAMNTTSEIGGMDCSNTADDFIKAGCYAVDLNQILFIGGFIALAGIIIGAKIIFG